MYCIYQLLPGGPTFAGYLFHTRMRWEMSAWHTNALSTGAAQLQSQVLLGRFVGFSQCPAGSEDLASSW